MEQNPSMPKTQKWGSNNNYNDPQPQITAINASVQDWKKMLPTWVATKELIPVTAMNQAVLRVPQKPLIRLTIPMLHGIDKHPTPDHWRLRKQSTQKQDSESDSNSDYVCISMQDLMNST